MGTPQISVDFLFYLKEHYNTVPDLIVTNPDQKVGRKQIQTAPEVKEFVEKSVNTTESEQMFLLAFLFACTEDHFRIDSGILTIEACISIAPEGDCIRKKDKAIRSRSETK